MHNTDTYTYDTLFNDIKVFKKEHRHIPVFSVGKSTEGRNLFAVKLGSGPRKIFYNAAHHGTEWLTAKVLFAFINDLAEGKHNFSDMAEKVSLYAIPMVNPDGVQIASLGKYWQANARGVDLNHNYDAMWQLSKSLEEKVGICGPCATRFGGDFPESEAESRAVANFTRQNKFDMAMALHSQGEVIYYDFCGFVPDGTEEYLKRFEAVSQYTRDIPSGISSYGGYKDWFIKAFRRPAFTVEIGIGENPLPLSAFKEVYAGVLPILKEGIC